MSQVTQILVAIDKGDVHAVDQLFPLVYQELRQLAGRQMRQESPGQTLQATALVNEAYLRLVDNKDQHWNGRYHFFSAAAEAMRRILIENARRKKSVRHGGGHKRIELDKALLIGDADSANDDLIALDEALEKLSQKDQKKADLVKLRYFAGLTSDQAAQVLGISPTTADRYWTYARSWLGVEITRSE
ncbi:MAG: sigma-70 family RNA polymerase sigma factor [Planctomycetota bacterium]|jgi:RNA polymerase sigma factor (TIGR02999 family)